MAGPAPLHGPVPEQILDHHRAVSVPEAWDSSFPAKRKNSVIKRKYNALCCMGPAAGFLEARKW